MTLSMGGRGRLWDGRRLTVEPGSIVYQGTGGRTMTAWLWHQKGRLRVTPEPGMPAWPSRPIGEEPPALGREQAIQDVNETTD